MKFDRNCLHCGNYIEQETAHSWCLGPRAGHYCFGCEPPGHECVMVAEPLVCDEYPDNKLNDDWGA